MYPFNPFLTFLNYFSGSAACDLSRSIIPKYHNPLLYAGYEARRTVRQEFAKWNSWTLDYQLSTMRYLRFLGNPFTRGLESVLEATSTMNERFARDFSKPQFGISEVETADGLVSVKETSILDLPFGSLLHFRRDTERQDPKILVVCPMSGHYSTLLRDTVKTLLIDHEVYVTDWHNARDVPSYEGTFGFESYVQYVMDFLREIGPETHLLAVCQPTVPCLTATAIMETEKDPCHPASLTLMGGPIDTAAAPTSVTEFAESKSIEWFEKNVIAEVPVQYEGSGRLVYPGFLQLRAFLSMNPEKHLRSQLELFANLALNETEKSEKTEKFYDEYLAVCDLPGRFYLETIDRVFLRRDLAQGTMTFHGELVQPEDIKRVPIFTVEGERDDISAPGQTIAAHRLCSGLSEEKKFNYLQDGVGHYGVFSGSRWRSEIAPRITNFVRRHSSLDRLSSPRFSKPVELASLSLGGRA